MYNLRKTLLIIDDEPAIRLILEHYFASEYEVLRKRGVNPRDMLDQITQWRKETADRELVFTSNAAHSPSHNAAAQVQAQADLQTAVQDANQ